MDIANLRILLEASAAPVKEGLADADRLIKAWATKTHPSAQIGVQFGTGGRGGFGGDPAKIQAATNAKLLAGEKMHNQQIAQLQANADAREEARQASHQNKLLQQQESFEQKTAQLATRRAARQPQRDAAKVSAARDRIGDSFSTGATMAGGATLVGLGLAAREAIQFESSFAEVQKSVKGTDDQLAQLQTRLRELAAGEKAIPVDVNQLNAIAASAGQLGIQTPAILGFTRVVGDLGVATNLAGEEGASSLAKIANITQMNQANFDRLGSTIVALGNDGASTEKDIAQMGLRIAGAGHQIGLSEAEILGFANALSSVGIEAESGGSAISRVFINIDKAARGGGDALTNFARVSGMTADEFQKKFKQDAAGAITSFIEGLGKIQKSGGDVFGTLDKLGLGEIRVRDALLRTAGAGDLLSNSLRVGEKAWADNNALTIEAEKRYKTTASQIQIVENRSRELAIASSDALLPALTDIIKATSGAFKWFHDLSPEAKNLTVKIALFGGATLLAAGRVKVLIELLKDARIAFGLTAVSSAAMGDATVASSAASIGAIGRLKAAVVGLQAFVAANPILIGVTLGGAAYELGRDKATTHSIAEMAMNPVESFNRLTGRFKADVLGDIDDYDNNVRGGWAGARSQKIAEEYQKRRHAQKLRETAARLGLPFSGGAAPSLPPMPVPRLPPVSTSPAFAPDLVDSGGGGGGRRASTGFNKYGLYGPTANDRADLRYNEDQRRVKAEQKEISPYNLRKLPRIVVEPNAFRLPAATERVPMASENENTRLKSSALGVARVREEYLQFLKVRGRFDGSFSDFQKQLAQNAKDAADKIRDQKDAYRDANRELQDRINLLGHEAALTAAGVDETEKARRLEMLRYKQDVRSDPKFTPAAREKLIAQKQKVLDATAKNEQIENYNEAMKTLEEFADSVKERIASNMKQFGADSQTFENEMWSGYYAGEEKRKADESSQHESYVDNVQRPSDERQTQRKAEIDQFITDIQNRIRLMSMPAGIGREVENTQQGLRRSGWNQTEIDKVTPQIRDGLDFEEKLAKVREAADRARGVIEQSLTDGFERGIGNGVKSFAHGIAQMIRQRALSELSGQITERFFGAAYHAAGGNGAMYGDERRYDVFGQRRGGDESGGDATNGNANHAAVQHLSSYARALLGSPQLQTYAGGGDVFGQMRGTPTFTPGIAGGSFPQPQRQFVPDIQNFPMDAHRHGRIGESIGGAIAAALGGGGSDGQVLENVTFKNARFTGANISTSGGASPSGSGSKPSGDQIIQHILGAFG
jgi:TP901 family phage tail tape measure protein